MTDQPLAINLRAKKLGVLMRDARLSSNKSVDECAEAMGVSEARYGEYELGVKSPSLPEVEILAIKLDVPVEHFWGRSTRPERTSENHFDPQQLIPLRQRIIGVQLRQARLESGKSIESLAEETMISPERLQQYEMGEKAIPMPSLEIIAVALKRPVKDFQDQHGPVGVWSIRQRAINGLLEMPPDMQNFVSKPINRPYIELAQRLSEMSVEKLRTVAEGLLEITL
jgi:transcriptional regulator with XRE-family HTH domain